MKYYKLLNACVVKKLCQKCKNLYFYLFLSVINQKIGTCILQRKIEVRLIITKWTWQNFQEDKPHLQAETNVDSGRDLGGIEKKDVDVLVQGGYHVVRIQEHISLAEHGGHEVAAQLQASVVIFYRFFQLEKSK